MTTLLIENGRAVSSQRVPVTQWFKASRYLEGRKALLKDGRVSFEYSPANVETFQRFFEGVKVENKDEQAKAYEQFAVRDRPQFAFKREPMPHQKKAFDKFKDQPLTAIFGDVGSGKSKILTDLAAWYYCQGKIDAVVIVAVNHLVIEQWSLSQLPRDMPDSVKWSAWTWNKTKKGAAQYDTLKEFDGLQIVTINVDALRTDKGVSLCQDFINRHKGRVLFAIDESQTIKNPSAQRTKKTIALAHTCKFRSILSGTPIARDLVDYWAQFKALDPNIIGHKYLSSFKARYCVTRWNGFADEVVGSKNEEELYAKTDPYTFRITKKELGFEEMEDTFEFDLGVEERKHFDSLKKLFLTQLDTGEIVQVNQAITAMLRMQQVSNGFLQHEDGTIQTFECSRLEAMTSWLETVSDDKLVIWCRFKQDGKMILDRLGKQAVNITGLVSPEERSREKDTFIHDKTVRFAVGTPKAAGVGVDGLQSVTNRALYYSNSMDSIDYWQSKARTSRVGGESVAYYTHLIGRQTIDLKNLRNLQKKEALSSLVLDDLRMMFE